MKTVEGKRADAGILFEKINAALDSGQPCNDQDLATLFAYAFDPQKSVWSWCNDYFTLAGRLPCVREKMLEIMRTGKARDRWIVAIHVNPDKAGADFCKEIIKMALQDQSKKVRLYGIFRASSFGYKDFAGLVKNAVDLENDPEQKELLTRYYRFLTEDFFIEKYDEGKYRVHYNHGWRGFESNIEDPEELREYVLEHFSKDIYL